MGYHINSCEDVGEIYEKFYDLHFSKLEKIENLDKFLIDIKKK